MFQLHYFINNAVDVVSGRGAVVIPDLQLSKYHYTNKSHSATMLSTAQTWSLCGLAKILVLSRD